MNLKKLAELIHIREAEAAGVALRKEVEPYLKQFVAEKRAGRKPDRKKYRSAITRAASKGMLQLQLKQALNYPIPTSVVLKRALLLFKGQEDLLEDFIRRYGLALDRGMKPADDHYKLKRLVLVLWQDGFGVFPARNRKDAAFNRRTPPLSRWNLLASLEFLRILEPGLDFRTWRKRVSRWDLHQVEPILVQKVKLYPQTFTVAYTPAGMQWLHSLGIVTRNGKKMSQDMETLARFNTANGRGGEITVQRARTGRVRSGQRTPNNSPDLHPVAGARSALSLDRIQPERARGYLRSKREKQLEAAR
jgi:hypothetical protein